MKTVEELYFLLRDARYYLEREDLAWNAGYKECCEEIDKVLSEMLAANLCKIISSPSITWGKVLEILNSPGQEGMTNRQICETGNYLYEDVSSLTRIMAKSGEIFSYQRTLEKSPVLYFGAKHKWLAKLREKEGKLIDRKQTHDEKMGAKQHVRS